MKALVLTRKVVLPDGTHGPEIHARMRDWMGWCQIPGTPNDLPLGSMMPVWVFMDGRSGVKYAASLVKAIEDIPDVVVMRKPDGTHYLELDEGERYEPDGTLRNLWFKVFGR